jgi:hypothetical protein
MRPMELEYIGMGSKIINNGVNSLRARFDIY